MTIASTLFTSNVSQPSEAKGPRAGLLTLPINSSKVSFATYFWMLPPMPKLKGWLEGSQGGETFVTQPSTRLPDRRHLSWKHMPCPTAMSCGWWASRHWGDLKAAQPSSLSMTLFVPQGRPKITTKHAQMDMFMISSQVHDVPMTSQKPSTFAYHLVSSHIPVPSISAQFSFASSLVAQSASVEGLKFTGLEAPGKLKKSVIFNPRWLQWKMSWDFCHQKFQIKAV